MKIAIIGAGVSGLVTAKVLSAYGHLVTIFEQRNGLGGVWEKSRRHAGLKLQSVREIYVFSDFDMPESYPQIPSGEQIASYLDAYAEQFELKRRIRLGTRVTGMHRRERAKLGWRLALIDCQSQAPAPAEEFDHVVVCNGLFTNPVTFEIPGQHEFEQAGGRVVHSTQFDNAEAAAGKQVVVVGFGKSALDIAYAALTVAKCVTLVCRRTIWHLPEKLFGILPAKYFFYSRPAEFWFGKQTKGLEGLIDRRPRWLVRLVFFFSQLLVGSHLGLLRERFRPPFPFHESIGLPTGFGFPDNLRALRNGRISFFKGNIKKLSPRGMILDTGEIIPAEIVVLAIGFSQDLEMLSPEDRAKLTPLGGDYRLYRNIVCPGLADMTFNGYNNSTAVPLTSEVAAHWIARWLDGSLPRPSDKTMNAVIDRDLAWRRAHLRGSDRFGHFVSPFSFGYLDTLLADMNLPPADARHSWLVRQFAVLNPKDYAFLNKVQMPTPRSRLGLDETDKWKSDHEAAPFAGLRR